jgi:hypothetical protein
VAARSAMKQGRGRGAGRLAHVLGVAALFAVAASPPASQQPLKKLLMLDFELIDEQAGVVPFPEKAARLAMVSQRLRAALLNEGLYDVVDNAPVAQRIQTEAARQSLLECNGCELEIARQAGADRVLLAWVQKVSNLILNLNIEIRDAKTGQPVLVKSVDVRGNTDLSWQRGIDFMVHEMVEKTQGNR